MTAFNSSASNGSEPIKYLAVKQQCKTQQCTQSCKLTYSLIPYVETKVVTASSVCGARQQTGHSASLPATVMCLITKIHYHPGELMGWVCLQIAVAACMCSSKAAGWIHFFGVFNNACDNINILLAVLRWVKPTLSVEAIPTLHGSWSRWKLHGVNVQREQQFPNLHACHHVIQY